MTGTPTITNVGGTQVVWAANVAGPTGAQSTTDPAGNGTTPNAPDDDYLRVASWAAQGAGNGQRGIQLNLDSTGWYNLQLSFDIFAPAAGSKYYQVQYTTNNGANWTAAPGGLITINTANTYQNKTVSLSAIPATDDNPNLDIRIVAIFDPLSGTSYSPISGVYNPGAQIRFDYITITGDATPIPEPSTALYAVCGGLLVIVGRFRRQS